MFTLEITIKVEGQKFTATANNEFLGYFDNKLQIAENIAEIAKILGLEYNQIKSHHPVLSDLIACILKKSKTSSKK